MHSEEFIELAAEQKVKREKNMTRHGDNSEKVTNVKYC